MVNNSENKFAIKFSFGVFIRTLFLVLVCYALYYLVLLLPSVQFLFSFLLPSQLLPLSLGVLILLGGFLLLPWFVRIVGNRLVGRFAIKDSNAVIKSTTIFFCLMGGLTLLFLTWENVSNFISAIFSIRTLGTVLAARFITYIGISILFPFVIYVLLSYRFSKLAKVFIVSNSGLLAAPLAVNIAQRQGSVKEKIFGVCVAILLLPVALLLSAFIETSVEGEFLPNQVNILFLSTQLIILGVASVIFHKKHPFFVRTLLMFTAILFIVELFLVFLTTWSSR
ncbi:MAG TPA: hypothetical protein VJI96_04225 [Candidatus Andersenbacteria bacterium]|nr:hypothetical protein [Candidatus Andersenbacteria bacterium]